MIATNKHCPLCLMKGNYSILKFYQINVKEATLMCGNDECPFPFVKGCKVPIIQRDAYEAYKQASLKALGKLTLESEMNDKGSHDKGAVSSQSTEFGDCNDYLDLHPKPDQDPNVDLSNICEKLYDIVGNLRKVPCSPYIFKSSSNKSSKTSRSCTVSVTDNVIHKSVRELKKIGARVVNLRNTASHAMMEEENQTEACISQPSTHECTDPSNFLGSDIIKNIDGTRN